MSHCWSRNFHKRPHCRLVTLPDRKWIRPLLTLSNTCFLGGGNKSQSRKWHLYRFSHFRTAYPRGSPCFSIGRITPKLPLPIGDLDPHITYGFLGPHESAPKRHLDQFSCFFCRAHECDQQTDTHTNRPCYSICSSYPHLTQCV